MDGIKELLEINDKFDFNHRSYCELCEGDCKGDNFCWYYATAEDWYYDDYIYNCRTGLDGVIDFEELKDFWTVKRFSYQECTIC